MYGKDRTSKGEVGVIVDQGMLKANFPRQYFGGKQVRRAFGLKDTPENRIKAERIAQRMTMDFQDGCFDLTLNKYGIKNNLKLVNPGLTNNDGVPPKPEPSILEVWDMYCEYRKKGLAITTYENNYRGTFLNFIESAVNEVGENPLDIRNWLVENRNMVSTKNILSSLSKAYALATRHKLVSYNPFEGMSDDLGLGARYETISQDSGEDDTDILDKEKAFTWDEVGEILNYLKNCSKLRHWHDFVKFKFLTGCRTGEACGLWWKDVKWDDECIAIDRSYDRLVRKFKPTKNRTCRIFPMPKDGELWKLLKSIPQTSQNEVVFLSRHKKIINCGVLGAAWRGREDKDVKGFIPTLIEQGKVRKYLPPYNTRHTFINHQINDCGIPPHIVNAWCEHSEQTSQKHYRQLDLKIIPGYGEKVIEKTEAELLREQIEVLSKKLDSLTRE